MHLSDMDLMRRKIYFRNLREEEEEEKPEKESVVIDPTRRTEKVATYV